MDRNCPTESKPLEDFKMMDQSKGKQLQPKQKAVSQLKVRSDMRAGNDCGLGLQYWKKEYQHWKQIAQNMGCI